MSIVFDGEYDLFRFPFRRPPMGSYTQHGTPAKLGFSTTDHRPLQMEAHQKLDVPIDPRCCSKVRVGLWNADQYPGTVALDLTLLDGDRPLYLGRAPVLSSTNSFETVDFAIPPEPNIAAVNEFQVTFVRSKVRADHSARISIEKFVLVPR
jgi:hypothetical protein